MSTSQGSWMYPGSPILYSTTDEFLEKTGFESLNDLPTIGEYFSSPSEEE